MSDKNTSSTDDVSANNPLVFPGNPLPGQMSLFSGVLSIPAGASVKESRHALRFVTRSLKYFKKHSYSQAAKRLAADTLAAEINSL